MFTLFIVALLLIAIFGLGFGVIFHLLLLPFIWLFSFLSWIIQIILVFSWTIITLPYSIIKSLFRF